MLRHRAGLQSTTGETRLDKFNTWKAALQGTDKKAQKDAAVSLTRSALTEEGIIECVQAGVPKALVLLLMGGDAHEMELAAWALVNMASSEEGSVACVEAEAPSALVAALINADLKPSAKEKVANAITNIAMSEHGANACAESNACEALVKIMSRERRPWPLHLAPTTAHRTFLSKPPKATTTNQNNPDPIPFVQRTT